MQLNTKLRKLCKWSCFDAFDIVHLWAFVIQSVRSQKQTRNQYASAHKGNAIPAGHVYCKCNVNKNSVGVDSLKLHTYHSKYNSCKYYFMVTSLWNSLPDSVVSTVSVKSFQEQT